MQRTLGKSLANAAALAAMLGAAGMNVAVSPAAQSQVSSPTSASSKGTLARAVGAAADILGLWGGGYSRGRRRPVGKRYRASVRQHQRHARKLRNRKAAR